jgi:hypothetical protein
VEQCISTGGDFMGSRVSISLLVGAVLFFAATARAQSYTKLAPSDPVVHVANGQGTETIYFSKTDAAAMPIKILPTEATGKINSLPVTDITAGDPVPLQGNVFSVSLTVMTSQFVEPDTPYEAALLLFESQKGTTPTTVKFKILDDATISFDTTPSTITTSVGGSLCPHERIRVRNNGKVTIRSLHITSSTLVDSLNHHTTQLSPSDQSLSLPPNHSVDLDIDLPQPTFAGMYTGTIIIGANQLYEKNISLTLQSRGPFGNLRAVPLFLFVLVILLGFSLSTILDAWFGSGGLARAEAYISLKTSEQALAKQIDNIAQWKSTLPGLNPPVDVPKAGLWLPQTLRQLQDAWATYPDRPVVEVTADASAFAIRAAVADQLWSAILTATKQWKNSPEKLRDVCLALDNVSLPETPADLERYRKDLTSALVLATQKVTTQATALLQPDKPKGLSVRGLLDKIHRMTGLYQAIIWIVVFVTAYSSFYAGHFAFGTLADYFALFLWAIGLTSTGTQIITRVNKL